MKHLTLPELHAIHPDLAECLTCDIIVRALTHAGYDLYKIVPMCKPDIARFGLKTALLTFIYNLTMEKSNEN